MNYPKRKHIKEVTSSLVEKFNYSSVIQTPKVDKIVTSTDVDDVVSNVKNLDKAAEELALTTGQKPFTTKAKKSIAGFRLREEMPIGAEVAPYGEEMYEFLDKLVIVSLPRVHGFHGVSKKAFDGCGNYTLGIKEQLIFLEVNYDLVNKVCGMDTVTVTTTNADEESRELLAQLGMPSRK